MPQHEDMEKKEVKESRRKGLGISQPSISTLEGSGHSVTLGMDKEGGTEERENQSQLLTEWLRPGQKFLMGVYFFL